MIVLETVLNRLRGTGHVLRVGSFRVTGTMIYALYLGLLFGLLTTWYKWETQEIYYGFIHFICNTYIILKVFYGI